MNNPCPTYATLAKVATIAPGTNTAPDRTGAPVDGALNTDGTVTPVTAIADPTTYGYYVPETKHNIAAPFWAFLTQQGNVVGADGKTDDRQTLRPALLRRRPAAHRAVLDEGECRRQIARCADAGVRAARPHLYTGEPRRLQGGDGQCGRGLCPLALWPGRRCRPPSRRSSRATARPDRCCSSPRRASRRTRRSCSASPTRTAIPSRSRAARRGARASRAPSSRRTRRTIPSAPYKANLIGTKSNQTRPGDFTLVAAPANGLIVQALPGTGDALTTYTLYASGLNPGDTSMSG